MYEELFHELGFSERETKVYLALLELGKVTVGPIASKTRIQHSKIYQTLERLIDKGLVSYIFISKTKYFEAVSPKELINILKDKEKKLLETLPNLEKLRTLSSYQQFARVYEGYSSIKSLFNLILEEINPKSFYFAFALKDEYVYSEQSSLLLRNLHMQLAEKKIDDRVIAQISIKKKIVENFNGIKNIRIRFTDMNTSIGLIILGDKIISLVWGERPTAIEIQSKQIASKYKDFFLEIWKNSKK